MKKKNNEFNNNNLRYKCHTLNNQQIINRTNRKKIYNEMEHVNHTKKQIDLTGTYEILHPTIE